MDWRGVLTAQIEQPRQTGILRPKTAQFLLKPVDLTDRDHIRRTHRRILARRRRAPAARAGFTERHSPDRDAFVAELGHDLALTAEGLTIAAYRRDLRPSSSRRSIRETWSRETLAAHAHRVR